MNHVSLDEQPVAVRDFILNLAAEPAGSVMELGGRAVACVVPPPRGENGAASLSEWSSELNHRRCELIDRDIDGAITPAERVELISLQSAIRRWLDKVAPLPIAEARKLHQELVDKAIAATGGTV
jgi:hypothetical protein